VVEIFLAHLEKLPKTVTNQKLTKGRRKMRTVWERLYTKLRSELSHSPTLQSRTNTHNEAVMKSRLPKSFALYCLFAAAPGFANSLAIPLKIFPTNIFNNDSVTRRVANAEELRWTVNVGGCSGSMLSTRYLITANHCSPRADSKYTSGGCMVLNCKSDMQAVRVVESFADLDVSIVEVKWLRADTAWKQRYTPQIQMKSEEVTTGRDGGSTTKIFTVGYPVDKRGSAMYAEGYAKAKPGSSLRYNVGIINGNSGGPVWRHDDYTLVSLTNNGPHAFNERGWNNNDPENSNSWNGGPQMDVVYRRSKILPTIFKDGMNPNVSWEGYLLYDPSLPRP
jgi:hypothetical protein